MFGSYRRLLLIRGFGAPFLLASLTAVALGMTSLGLVLAVHERYGSLGPAGLTSGAFGLGNAIGLLVQGRLIDRRGQTAVLIVSSPLCAVALMGAVIPSWSTSAVVACLAGLAGASFPATISGLRVLTADLVPVENLRTSAYALLAVSFGAAMTIGPLLVSGIVLICGPVVAVVSAAAVTALGGVAFALSPAVRSWRPRPSAAEPGMDLHSGFVTLLMGNAGTGFAAGVTAVALPAVGIAHGHAALAGLGFAALSGGDLLGGLAYGAIRWRSSTVIHLRRGIVLWAGAAWLMAASEESVPAILAVLTLSGLVAAAVPICSSALLDSLSPAGSLTTHYTLMVGAGLLAAAAGSAIAGGVAQRYGATTTLALSAAVITAAAVWITTRSRTLATEPTRPYRSFSGSR